MKGVILNLEARTSKKGNLYHKLLVQVGDVCGFCFDFSGKRTKGDTVEFTVGLNSRNELELKIKD